MITTTRRRLLALLASAPIAAAALPAFSQAPKTLTVGIVSDPVTLDPAMMASFFEIWVQYNLFEPLVHVKPDLAIEPGLASVETPDPLTYNFTLKPNLTFHDGTPIDAAAAKVNAGQVDGANVTINIGPGTFAEAVGFSGSPASLTVTGAGRSATTVVGAVVPSEGFSVALAFSGNTPYPVTIQRVSISAVTPPDPATLGASGAAAFGIFVSCASKPSGGA